MYVCTTGIGRRDPRAQLSPRALAPGDRILLSGSIGEHGTAIMLARGEFELDAEIESDTGSLWPAVDALLRAPSVRACAACAMPPAAGWRRCSTSSRAVLDGGDDRARGRRSRSTPAVAGAAEILGIDPMYVANEGKLVAFVAPERGGRGAGGAARRRGCELAAEIGEVRTEPPGMVLVQTSFGGRRVMDQLVGDPLPRIC